MKLFLSLLVVANVLLFGWFRGWMAPFGGDGREPQRLERQLRPEQLRVLPAARQPAAGASGVTPAAAAAGARGSAPPATVAALRTAGCAQIGPIGEAEYVRVQAALEALSPDLDISAVRLDEVTSWWVYLPPVRGGDVSRRLADLRDRGVGDTYLMPEGVWKGAVSLGLFRQEDGAVGLQRTLAQKGVVGVRVIPRGPPPGRMILKVKPVHDAVASELLKLGAEFPEAALGPCETRG